MVASSGLNHQQNSEKNQETHSELSSIHHSFDIALAERYGIEEAIMIHHIQYWVRINKRKGTNFVDGRTWTRQTRAFIKDHLPYFTYDKVRRLCEKLVEQGVLITLRQNRNPIDKTLSYAFVNEEAFGIKENSKNVYERQNCPTSGKFATPIEDSLEKDTYKKKNTKKKDETPAEAVALANIFFKMIKEKKPNFTKSITPKWIKTMTKLLSLRLEKEIIAVMEFAFKDDFYSKLMLEPDRLLRHLDALEMKMQSPMKNSASTLKENKEWLEKIKNKICHHSHIEILNEGIVFSGGQSQLFIKLSDVNFKKTVTERLSLMKIKID